MDGLILLILGLGGFVAVIFLMRMIGAWMLRIDEVISELKEIKKILQIK